MRQSTILIADDDAAIRTVVSHALTRAGYDVRAAGDAATLWQWIENGLGDLVITDVVMPDENGLDLIPRISRLRPDLRIVVMSAQTTLMTAVKATERGAFDYLPKPFDINNLISIVKRGIEAKNDIRIPMKKEVVEEALPLIGRSPAMQEVYRTIARLMSTDLTTMITGESGTGKELVARALHDYGKRQSAPFVPINMAAIPKELIESELFGHEKGAFTGAIANSAGRFEQAEGGTLFLDEIGDMPLEAQTRLLRVLQDGEYTRVGGRHPKNTNVRIVAATHHNLRQLIRQGLFREDLFFRLNVVPVNLPPLRDRSEDIPELVRHFLVKATDSGLPWKTIDAEAIKILCRYSWPGNVRELENLIQRLAALCPQEIIRARDIEEEFENSRVTLSPDTTVSANGGLAKEVESHLAEYFTAHKKNVLATDLYNRVLREIEKPLFTLTLQATRGNQIKAAKILGLNRNTLRKKIKELEIPIIRGGT